MSTVCIISFGNSTKYRLTLNEDPGQISDIKKEVTDYLAEKYPQLRALNFYDKVTVTPVTPENAAKYKDYEEFGPDSISQIKAVLSREVEDEESLHRLNSNEPWGSETSESRNL